MIYEIIIMAAIILAIIILGRKLPQISKFSILIKNDQGDKKILEDHISDKKKSDKLTSSLEEQAESYFQEANFKQAEEIYLKLATKNPEDAKIYNRLGIIYLEQNNYQDAVEAFRESIKNGGKKSSRYYNLSLAYYGLQEYRNAYESIDEAVKLDNNNDKYLKLQQEIKLVIEKFNPKKTKIDKKK